MINYNASPTGGQSTNDFRLQSGALNVAEGGSVRLRIFSLGNGGSGSSATIDGGSLTLTANAYIGNDNENGTFTLNSGTLNASASFTVGQYRGTGTYNQNGGTATIKIWSLAIIPPLPPLVTSIWRAVR